MKIGFIGLGQMGRGMAANLQAAGHEMVVHDLFREAAAPFLEKGATWADTPRELAAAVDVVCTSLPTPTDALDTANGENGLKAGFREGAVWIDLSTNSVDVVRQLHAELAENGVAFLDAPVSGGPAGAASGKLAIWVGGDREVFDASLDIFEAMSDAARYIGPIGAGTIAKLVHNMAVAVNYAMMGEVMSLGVKAGLDAAPLWEAIRSGAMGRMRTFDSVSGRFLQGKTETPSFALRLMHKDVSLALKLARDVSVPMRLADIVNSDMVEAINRGWGTKDSQSFLLLQTERAGIEPIAISAEDIQGAIDRT